MTALAKIILRVVDSLVTAFGLEPSEVDAWLLDSQPDVARALDATRKARAEAVRRVRE